MLPAWIEVWWREFQPQAKFYLSAVRDEDGIIGIAPLQVKVLPITDKELSYAKRICDKLIKDDIRVELDSRGEMLSYKIREAQLQKVPYMLIVGKKEKETNTVTIRRLNGENIKDVSLEKLSRMLEEEISTKN